MKQYTKKIINIIQPGLCTDNPLTMMIRLPQRGLSSQSLGKYR